MAYGKNIYSKANITLDNRRAKALDEAVLRKEKLYKEINRVEQIDRELVSTSVSIAKTVLKGSNVKAELEKLREHNENLQKERAELLKKYGYPEDYDEPQYFCAACEDKGSVEKNGKTVVCDCFKKLLTDIACDELNKTSPLSLSTFDSFKLSYYPENMEGQTASPYKRMSKIYDYCISYAYGFGANSKSLLMRGSTGLGKTHLSLAIANEVIKKGYGVVYVSAPDILSKLEKEHFSYNYQKENEITDTLLDCDLLIIDDLGTEFSTQFTTATIYNIFNSRILSKKPIIINTNMTLSELEATYSQRFVSRVIGCCDRLDFIGHDIRAKK